MRRCVFLGSILHIKTKQKHCLKTCLRCLASEPRSHGQTSLSVKPLTETKFVLKRLHDLFHSPRLDSATGKKGDCSNRWRELGWFLTLPHSAKKCETMNFSNYLLEKAKGNKTSFVTANQPFTKQCKGHLRMGGWRLKKKKLKTKAKK